MYRRLGPHWYRCCGGLCAVSQIPLLQRLLQIFRALLVMRLPPLLAPLLRTIMVRCYGAYCFHCQCVCWFQFRGFVGTEFASLPGFDIAALASSAVAAVSGAPVAALAILATVVLGDTAFFALSESTAIVVYVDTAVAVIGFIAFTALAGTNVEALPGYAFVTFTGVPLLPILMGSPLPPLLVPLL